MHMHNLEKVYRRCKILVITTIPFCIRVQKNYDIYWIYWVGSSSAFKLSATARMRAPFGTSGRVLCVGEFCCLGLVKCARL